MGSAFSSRLTSFQQTKRFTVDEAVYCTLAVQLKNNFPAYHIIPYAELLQESRSKSLAAYMFQPLFKHPPFFSFAISLSMRIFGENDQSAVIVSILFGVMMIPLTYFLGKEFFGKEIGLLAAFFLWLDPVNIMSSQKIWMDSTLSFLMLFSVYLFVLAKNSRKNVYLFLSGLVIGCAVLTKYTAIFALVSLLVYEILDSPERKLGVRKVLGSLAGIPFLMMIPWGIWNYQIYGSGFLTETLGHGHKVFSSSRGEVLVAALIIGVIVFCIRKMIGGPSQEIDEGENSDEEDRFSSVRKIFVYLFCLIFIWKLSGSVLKSLDLCAIPRTTWQAGYFQNPLFYFKQLTEYSFLYFFSFIAFFIPSEKRTQKALVLPLFAAMVLIFFMFWGAYQSRYILSVTPVLLILSLQFLKEIIEAVLRKCSKTSGLFLSAGVFLFFAYIVVKMNYVNYLVSVTNDMCYF